MPLRFGIKPLGGKAKMEGDSIVRYSGSSEPFSRVSGRDCKKVGVDAVGEPIIQFTTGLDEEQVKFYAWYNEDEKKLVKEQIAELGKTINEYYGGSAVTDHRNKYFWLENRDINRLSLSHETMDAFYDTKNPAHALLYLSVIGGAFIDLVAPTKEWAERNQIYHYLVLESEDLIEGDDDITRSDAHGALSELRRDASTEALFILAWCIQYDTNAFGGINKATPMKSLINTHIQYIDGKLVSKKKRNTPVVFLEYFKKWNAQQTRPLLYTEAYLKAGEYFGYINQNEKKYVTQDGTILGNTISESVTTIMKPKFRADLEKLTEQVEKKWNS